MSSADVNIAKPEQAQAPSDTAAPRERERWSSRVAFYFAAIGSAVGFGNIWRFPALVYDYGTSFFVPYILALVFIGLPILVLEISLGQYYETGDVDVFGGIHKRLRGIGLCSVACGYMIVTYYSMLLSWVAHAFFDSFSSDTVWETDVTGSEAKSYFYNEIIGMETLGSDLKPTRVVWNNVGYSLFTWVIVLLCVVFGIKWTGRITYFTMGFPVILLFVFLGRAVTLEGSQDGISEYLSSDWSVLVNRPEVWPKAVSQIFFSIGITFGIMTAYGSHCYRDEPAFLNSTVIAFTNSLFSFIAGFAVFATLGHLAYIEGTTIAELEFSGFGLVFGSWPVALATLPGGIHWVRLFFSLLFLLGIDSAFSFNEGFLICLADTSFLSNVGRKKLAVGIAFSAWLFSFLYATDAGLIFLDTIDYYINFCMLLVGFAECFAAGWIYNIEEQCDNLGRALVFTFMSTTFGSILVGCICWFSITDPNTALWAGFVGWIASFVFGMAVVCFLMKRRMDKYPCYWSWKSMFYDLMFRNMMDLRDDLSGVVGYLPVLWPVLIKFFIPEVLLVLFALGCTATNSSGQTEFGHYEGYPTHPYQVLGIFAVVFAAFLIVSSLIMPRLYDAFQKQDSPVSKDKKMDVSIHGLPQVEEKENGDFGIATSTAKGEGVWPPAGPSEHTRRASSALTQDDGEGL